MLASLIGKPYLSALQYTLNTTSPNKVSISFATVVVRGTSDRLLEGSAKILRILITESKGNLTNGFVRSGYKRRTTSQP